MSELRAKTIAGVGWMVGMRFIVNIIGFISTAILAHLLTPADFGVVALAGSAYAFFTLLGQFGFDNALIFLKDAEKAHYDTAWTANIITGVLIAVILYMVAKPAAIFFEDTRIEYVIYSFTILSLAKGYENIGVVNFRKYLEFRGDFLYFVVPKIIGVMTGITAAFILRNYWALVIGMAASQLTTLIYSHLSQPLRPKLSLAKFYELFSYTRWILANNLLRYLSNNSIELIIGKIQNTSAVGIFGIARQIAYLPSTEIMAPINRALFPSFSSISEDTTRIRSIFFKAISMISLLTIPSAFGILAVSDLIVLVLLGSKWTAVGPILSVLGFVGVLQSVSSLGGPILRARGKPKKVTRFLVQNVILLLPLSIAGAIHFGTIGVAYASLLSTFIMTPVILTAVKKEIECNLYLISKCIWRPLVASIIMSLTVHFAKLSTLSLFSTASISLPILIIIGIVVYCFVILIFWIIAGRPDGAEREVLILILKYFHRHRVNPA